MFLPHTCYLGREFFILNPEEQATYFFSLPGLRHTWIWSAVDFYRKHFKRRLGTILGGVFFLGIMFLFNSFSIKV